MFIRKQENFICEHCGAEVRGNGYTNHCPKCLWSKHVDVDPGDRLSSCGGLMEPMGYQNKSGEERILYRCVKCGHERPNHVAEGDSREALLDITKN